MAAIIDGITHSGYWKFGDTTSVVYYLIPKNGAMFQKLTSTTGKIFLTYSNTFVLNTDSGAVDHNNNALDTSDKIAEYFELYR